jgi:hypothetical protein
MGNIISDSSGNIRTLDTSGNAISNDVFTQNITDALFELNLYNTGNYYSNVKDGVIRSGDEPRSELDYTEDGTSLSTSNNVDKANTVSLYIFVNVETESM